MEYLKSTTGDRLIFVAGSNVGHGFDSAFLERELNRPIVNMGLHANLGLVYQMRAVEDGIHSRDTIILMPEYPQFKDDYCLGEDELLALVATLMPEHRALLDFRQWYKMIFKIPTTGARKLFRPISLFSGGKSKMRYNHYGDSQEYLNYTNRTSFASNLRGYKAEDYSDLVIPYINSFISQCKKKGARVLIMPPVHEKTSFDAERALIDRIRKELERNGTPFEADPARYALPDELFAETAYHLNCRGVPVRMKLLVEDLRRILHEP